MSPVEFVEQLPTGMTATGTHNDGGVIATTGTNENEEIAQEECEEEPSEQEPEETPPWRQRDWRVNEPREPPYPPPKRSRYD